MSENRTCFSCAKWGKKECSLAIKEKLDAPAKQSDPSILYTIKPCDKHSDFDMVPNPIFFEPWMFPKNPLYKLEEIPAVEEISFENVVNLLLDNALKSLDIKMTKSQRHQYLSELRPEIERRLKLKYRQEEYHELIRLIKTED